MLATPDRAGRPGSQRAGSSSLSAKQTRSGGPRDIQGKATLGEGAVRYFSVSSNEQSPFQSDFLPRVFALGGRTHPQ